MTEVKRGMLKYYHRGLFSKKWKVYKFVLYDSSLLMWYTDNKQSKPNGMILLKDVERFICVGPYTRCLPDFPHLENEFDQVALIALPMSIQNRERDIIWLLCEDQSDLNSWMKAIVRTLPPYTMQEAGDNQSDFGSNSPSTSTIGSRHQNFKINPLTKAGYNYGDTLWGTGEGWGYFSPLTLPGFAAIGGTAPHRTLTDDEKEIAREVIHSSDEDEDKNDDDDIDHENDEDGIFGQAREALELIHGE